MNRAFPLLVLLLSFVVGLSATFPLRTALAMAGASEHGLAAREVTGSVWNGSLRDARFQNLAVGDVIVRLDGKSVLGGNPKFLLQSGDQKFVFDLRAGTAFPAGQ
jgi:general secretion pathway protein N